MAMLNPPVRRRRNKLEVNSHDHDGAEANLYHDLREQVCVRDGKRPVNLACAIVHLPRLVEFSTAAAATRARRRVRVQIKKLQLNN